MLYCSHQINGGYEDRDETRRTNTNYYYICTLLPSRTRSHSIGTIALTLIKQKTTSQLNCKPDSLPPPRRLRTLHGRSLSNWLRRLHFISRDIAIFLLFFLIGLTSLSEFVHTFEVNLVLPALVEPNEEDNVVSKGRESMQQGHFDSPGEEVVDEGV